MQSLLYQTLCCVGSKSPAEYLGMNEVDLAAELKRALLRNKYLIVLDDVWDINAWNLLQLSFPDNGNGSRILFTSRIQNLTMQFNPESEPYHLHQFTREECFALLQRQIFGEKDCPPALVRVLIQVAKKCKGLPFTIVIVAGILSSIEPDHWQQFANSCNSSTVSEANVVELSYSHLPEDLKPCLLYFSAFPEDANISARKLLLLWISEGFVRKTTEGKSLEELADECLKALVDRSLVMVTEQRAIGGAKACQVHDLVHEFCVKKSKEESFLQILRRHNDLCTFSGLKNANPLSIHHSTAYNKKVTVSKLFYPNLRSLLIQIYSASTSTPELFNCGIGVLIFKLLRLLDLEVDLGYSFPEEVALLVHLRYLAINTEVMSIPDKIANLSRLETFLLKRSYGGAVSLPSTIWTIKTLRHLRTITSNFRRSRWCGFIFQDNLEGSPDLEHLISLSLVIPSHQSLQKILTKLPSIRRLTCKGDKMNCGFLQFDCLSQVGSLKIYGLEGSAFQFPSNLKKLTLAYIHKPWSEISAIGELPELEVLKLYFGSFKGTEWILKEGEFPKLRYLELRELSIQRWTATSSDQLPCLKKLILFGCHKLQELPSFLGESSSLGSIEVRTCPQVTSSVKQIVEEQRDNGNEGLEIIW